MVLRSTTSGGPYTIVAGGACSQSDTATLPTTSCTDNDPTLVPGTTYYYEVEAAYFNGSTMWTSVPNEQFSGSTTAVGPSLTTVANPATTTVGGSVSDQAIISGGYSPGGTITWGLYASTDATCKGAASFTSSPVNVLGDGTYAPPNSFTTNAAGTYKWSVVYSGDTANAAVSACGGNQESLTVDQATPGVSTSASVLANGSVTDAATIAGGYDPTGTITYTLYGPSSTAECTAQVGQVTTTVTSGNSTYSSPSITPPRPGMYWWIANYGGDTNNTPTSNVCGDTGESSIVGAVTPSITTMATPATVTVGGSVADQATLAGGDNATGKITWGLYKNASCSGRAIFTTSGGGTVTGNSTYTSNSYTVANAGTFTWGFSYSGDLNNNAVSACGGPNETVTVSLALHPSTLPAATVGQSYNCGTEITASGGTSPYTYHVTSGGLPPGLSLSASTGALTGTPTAGGTFTFVVTAVDSAGPPRNTGSKAYTLTVNRAIINLGPYTLPAGRVGSPYPTSTINAVGGTLPYTYALTNGLMPPGLVLSSTGVLSGTPTAVGLFWFEVTATDASAGTGPYSGSRSYAVTINPAAINHAPTIVSASSDSFVAGSAGSFTVVATGSPTPIVTNGAFGTCRASPLPKGVTFTNYKNGTATIASTSASPTSSTTFCIIAANGLSPNATQRFILTIAAAPGRPPQHWTRLRCSARPTQTPYWRSVARWC